jgi:hypothetical protein
VYGADSFFYDEDQKIYQVRKSNCRTYVYYRNIATSVSAMHKEKRHLQHQ